MPTDQSRGLKASSPRPPMTAGRASPLRRAGACFYQIIRSRLAIGELEFLCGRADDDLVNVNVGRLLDRIGDRACNSLGGQGCLFVQVQDQLPRRPRGVVFELTIDRAWLNGADADRRADLETQPVRYRANGKLGAGIDGSSWSENLDAGDRAHVDELAAILLNEDWQCCSDAIQDTLDIDIDHGIPFLGITLLNR